jgi:hypothetical protein
VVEDSARVFDPTTSGLSSSDLIRAAAAASPNADLRYYGYSGAVDQLDALYRHHVPRHGGPKPRSRCTDGVSDGVDGVGRVVPRDAHAEDGVDSGAVAGSGAADAGDVNSGDDGGGGGGDGGGGGGGVGLGGGGYAVVVPLPTRDMRKANVDEDTEADSQAESYDVLFGMFGYSLGRRGLARVLLSLRADIGSILWRPRRSKIARVKPVDRVFPRRL